MQTKDLYDQRFADVSQETRAAMWNVLCRVVLQRYVRPTDVVVDLGAGFGEFINAIKCREKIAIDANPSLPEFVDSGVRPIVAELQDALEGLEPESADVLFCSNVLEHLRDKEALLDVLRAAHRVLTPEGRFVIIQPNIRYAYKEYWDFFDHHVALSHGSLVEALQLTSFQLEELRPRFLPYTTKSRLPQHAWLVRLYLAFPPAQWLLGKQLLAVARKKSPRR